MFDTSTDGKLLFGSDFSHNYCRPLSQNILRSIEAASPMKLPPTQIKSRWRMFLGRPPTLLVLDCEYKHVQYGAQTINAAAM
jgi:hypothetical protein